MSRPDYINKIICTFIINETDNGCDGALNQIIYALCILTLAQSGVAINKYSVLFSKIFNLSTASTFFQPSVFFVFLINTSNLHLSTYYYHSLTE